MQEKQPKKLTLLKEVIKPFSKQQASKIHGGAAKPSSSGGGGGMVDKGM